MCEGILLYQYDAQFWKQLLTGDAVCITTNGIVRQNGLAVMGAGIALFARQNFPGIDKKLGKYLQKYGNRVFNLGMWSYNLKKIRLISFPTKYNWREKSNLELITTSAVQLGQIVEKFDIKTIFLPMPGINNGGLDRKHVYEAIKDIVHPNVKLFMVKNNDRRII